MVKHLSKSSIMYLGVLLLMQAGDCELNPGPNNDDSCSKFPCLVCDTSCTWSQKAIQCDECNGWYHTQCMGMDTINYEVLGNCNISWTCCQCGVPNFSTSLFSQWSLETSNSFYSLSTSGVDDLPLSPPVAASSPKSLPTKKTKPTNQKRKAQPRRQLKVMVVNFPKR